jgi:hypothetical protein
LIAAALSPIDFSLYIENRNVRYPIAAIKDSAGHDLFLRALKEGDAIFEQFQFVTTKLVTGYTTTIEMFRHVQHFVSP